MSRQPRNPPSPGSTRQGDADGNPPLLRRHFQLAAAPRDKGAQVTRGGPSARKPFGKGLALQPAPGLGAEASPRAFRRQAEAPEAGALREGDPGLAACREAFRSDEGENQNRRLKARGCFRWDRGRFQTGPAPSKRGLNKVVQGRAVDSSVAAKSRSAESDLFADLAKALAGEIQRLQAKRLVAACIAQEVEGCGETGGWSRHVVQGPGDQLGCQDVHLLI